MDTIASDGIPVPLQESDLEQSCVYIQDGDHHFEVYRLATFSQFPLGIPVKATELAMMGFYYTGHRDRVKCFSCGASVENFTQGDSAFDMRWHLPGCLLVAGQETSNVPTQMSKFRISLMQLPGKGRSQPSGNISSLLSVPGESMDVVGNLVMLRIQAQDELEKNMASILDQRHDAVVRSLNLSEEENRRKTFAKWPSYPCPFLPGELANDGFFYLGNFDRTQCFSCFGVLRNWAPGDDVREEHLKHFPHCRLASNMVTGNIPMTLHQRRVLDDEERARAALRTPDEQTFGPPDPSPVEQRQLESFFPCNEPINPFMESQERRTGTFQRWPGNIRATTQQLADAGFFFLGQSDKTKCFYCNGGLQNWEYNDEPWTEHAKWFPGCEFTVRKKGIDFVEKIVDMYPNLDRPTIRNAVPYLKISSFKRSFRSDRSSEAGPSSDRKRRVMQEGGTPDKAHRSTREPMMEANNDHSSSAQSCRYRAFPCGHENREEIRRASFAPYMDHCPVDAKKMAKEGFFYTGIQDKAKCFSCAAVAQNWINNRTQSYSHNINCTMAKNDDEQNVPCQGCDTSLFASLTSLCDCFVHDTRTGRCFEQNEPAENDSGDEEGEQSDEERDADSSDEEEHPRPDDLADIARQYNFEELPHGG